MNVKVQVCDSKNKSVASFCVFVHFAIEDDDEQQVIYSTQLSIQGSHVRFSLFFFLYKKNLQYFIMSFECV